MAAPESDTAASPSGAAGEGGSMGRRSALGLVLFALALALVGCARDPALVAWDGAFVETQRRALAGADEDARLSELERWAPRPVERAEARFARARAKLSRGEDLAAAELLADAGHSLSRRADRARAHYELARLAEARGRLAAAARIYRRLVRTYPDLMPGERSLAHLERLFGERGLRGARAHLAWTRDVFGSLRDSPVADNLIAYPARLAYRRFFATGEPRWARLAERLLRWIVTDYRASGLWNDAVWELSLLYHRQGRWRDEVAEIRRVQRSYEKLSLFGHDDHTYFWQGQLRIARLELLELSDPRAAAASYAAFVPRYPESIWCDDALYWQGCAWLQAGEAGRAARAFAELRAEHPESKYLRLIGDASRDPRAGHCVPKDFSRGGG